MKQYNVKKKAIKKIVEPNAEAKLLMGKYGIRNCSGDIIELKESRVKSDSRLNEYIELGEEGLIKRLIKLIKRLLRL